MSEIKNEIQEVNKLFLEKYKKVIEQREEILTAFIAKYGCQPNDIIQIEKHISPTEIQWY